MIERFTNVLKSLVLFTLIGPPVGYFAFMGVNSMTNPVGDITFFQFLFLAIFAYPVGAAPAAVTGLLAALLAHWLKGGRYYAAVGLVGGCVACVFAFGAWAPSEAGWVDLAEAFIPGFAGGAVCAWLFCWPEQRRQRNTRPVKTPRPVEE